MKLFLFYFSTICTAIDVAPAMCSIHASRYQDCISMNHTLFLRRTEIFKILFIPKLKIEINFHSI